MDQYKQAMQQNYAWQQFYQRDRPQDTGITSPEGYNILSDPQVPYVLTAAALGLDTAPVNYNPAAMLYTSGGNNMLLKASGTDMCDPGCVEIINKSDPRVFQVKPLYQPHVFKASAGTVLPTSYNVQGMY